MDQPGVAGPGAGPERRHARTNVECPSLVMMKLIPLIFVIYFRWRRYYISLLCVAIPQVVYVHLICLNVEIFALYIFSHNSRLLDIRENM